MVRHNLLDKSRCHTDDAHQNACCGGQPHQHRCLHGPSKQLAHQHQYSVTAKIKPRHYPEHQECDRPQHSSHLCPHPYHLFSRLHLPVLLVLTSPHRKHLPCQV